MFYPNEKIRTTATLCKIFSQDNINNHSLINKSFCKRLIDHFAEKCHVPSLGVE